MARYKICAHTGLINTQQERELDADEFNDEDWEKYESGQSYPDMDRELLNAAIDISGFEYWVERIDD